jgi:GWxTD domain-containing protein
VVEYLVVRTGMEPMAYCRQAFLRHSFYEKSPLVRAFLIGGERGIRTPGAFTPNGFQDRRNRPLCHLSAAKVQSFFLPQTLSVKKHFAACFHPLFSPVNWFVHGFTSVFRNFAMHFTKSEMKIRYFLMLALLAGFISSGSAMKLNAGFSYAVFQSPMQGPWVETWLSVNAATVEFVRIDNGKYRGEVEVVMIFFRNDSVANFKKYTLYSTEIEDTAGRNFGFLDQQRYLLPEGDYRLEISLQDVNSREPAVETTVAVTVDAPADRIAVSTVQLIANSLPATTVTNITKAGYDLYPDLHAFYPESSGKISFYCEIYNTINEWGKDGMFLLSAFIESVETRKLMNNISYYRRENAAQVVPLLHTFDISRLPSGNYNLVVEVRDKENKIVTSGRTFFQRSNPSVRMRLEDIAAIEVYNTFSAAYTNADTLAGYIRSCFPIAAETEKVFATNLLKEKDLRYMQQYLYHFWSVRDGANPQLAWLNYKAQVDRVNLTYSTFIKPGYDTDRGIIWLRYGEPNTIYRSTHEPEAYPYEIWHYYKLTANQNNRKFVFINSEMGSNDFHLAHSNAIGEMNDPQWHLKLHGRHVGGTNVDRTQYDANYGSRALEIFNNPY